MSKIELTHIDKYYGKNHVLKDLNLTIEDGDFMTLLGPSGCGKTTTLRVVSGLEKPQNGTMTIDGVEMINADDAYYAEPSKRGLNLVFQSYALFPHMTVEQNIAFGLKQDKLPKAEITSRVQEMLALVANVCQQQRLTLLMVSHSVEDAARIAPRSVVVAEGRIAWDGDTASLLSGNSSASTLLGISAK